MNILVSTNNLLKKLSSLDFLALFFIRVYLFFVFWPAGTSKIENIDKFSGWLDSMNIPLAEFMAWCVVIAEAGGAVLLLVGLFVRWATIPMLVTMGVVIFLVHWDNGWTREANGIEIAVTYSIMLLILQFSGGGKYLSLDYWVSR